MVTDNELLNYVIWGVVAIAVLWLVLGIASHVWKAFDQYFRGGFWGHNVVPYALRAQGEAVAESRRSTLSTFLSETGDSRRPTFEFVEVPPGFPSFERRSFGEDDDAVHWHASRLEMQLASTPMLLAERVTDGLVCLIRSGQLSRSAVPTCVRLVPRRYARRRALPWRVVMTTAEPEALAPWFTAERAAWFGIGIDLVKPRATTTSRTGTSTAPPPASPAPPAAMPQGKCTQGDDGLDGEVGGVMETSSNGSYGVTCRHVLSSRCGSIYGPSRFVRRKGSSIRNRPMPPSFAWMRAAS